MKSKKQIVNHAARNEMNQLVAKVLDAQSLSTAYQRGAASLGRIAIGSLFVDAKLEGVKLGYPTHSQENHLFVEGFLDALMDSGLVISTDEHHIVTALHAERFEVMQ